MSSGIRIGNVPTFFSSGIVFKRRSLFARLSYFHKLRPHSGRLNIVFPIWKAEGAVNLAGIPSRVIANNEDADANSREHTPPPLFPPPYLKILSCKSEVITFDIVTAAAAAAATHQEFTSQAARNAVRVRHHYTHCTRKKLPGDVNTT